MEERIRQRAEQTQEEPLSKKQDADIQKRARQIVDNLLDGDEEAATKALAEVMMGRGPATPTDTDQIVSKVAAQVQQQTELKSALKSFRDTYPAIAQDPTLWNRANQESGRLRDEHPEWSIEENILEAGKRVQDWLHSLTGGPRGDEPQQNDQVREGKLDKKRTMEKLPSASTRMPKAPEKRPPTRSDVVANMRKQRGLPS